MRGGFSALAAYFDENGHPTAVGQQLLLTLSQLFTGQGVLASYTVATLPPARAGGLVLVTDEAGGAVPAFADGANWRRVTDRAVVS